MSPFSLPLMTKVEVKADSSRNCGLCGDDFDIRPPRPNELGGRYANPIIRTRYYEAGQKADISIWNNLPGSPGFYEFRLCTDALNPSQACLDQHLLTIVDTNATSMVVPSQQGYNMIHVQLPVGVTCEYCLLQWRFSKGSSGCNSNNWCRLGYQSEYYNCADVTIGRVGQPKPNYIQDPVYSDADYGSAYDVVTTLTTQPIGGRVPTTPIPGGLSGTTARPTQVPIFTIPPLPGFPTQNPVVTTASSRGGVTERLVIDGSGNQVGQVLSGTSGITASSSNTNNRQLLLLLGLLPLIGAVALRNGNRIPPGPIGPGAPRFIAAGPPLSEYYLGTGIGFGNFGPGAVPVGFGGFGPRRFGRSVDDDRGSDEHEESTTHTTTPYVTEMEMDKSSKDESTGNPDTETPEVRVSRDTGSEYGQVVNEYGKTNNQPSQSQAFSGNQATSGSEYGHVDNEYGNTNNGAGQWPAVGANQPRSFGNQGITSGNRDFTTGNQGINSGIQRQKTAFMSTARRPNFRSQSRRFRNGNNIGNGEDNMVSVGGRRGRFGQGTRWKISPRNENTDESSNGNPIRPRLRSALARGNNAGDLDGLLRVMDMDGGFRSNGNPLSRTLSRGKIPSVHDWYMSFMTK